MKHKIQQLLSAFLLMGVVSVSSLCSVQAKSLPTVDMVVFGQPSLGGFLTPIVKSQKFDEKNGIIINFVERTPDAYIAQFNSGEFKVGGSAALLSIAIASSQGVKVSYLFNLFDYFGAVVTDKPDIKTLKDLEGKKLVASTSTTNYAMFKWLAKSSGLNLSKVAAQNTATPGLIGYALADRADAVQLWEPGYTILLSKKPSMRTLNLHIQENWKKFSGTSDIPYLGVAAHDDWVKKNPELVEKMYLTFKDAADWMLANTGEAAKLVSAAIRGSDVKVIHELIKDNDRLGSNVRRAGDIRPSIEAVYAAGLESGYLKKPVDKSTIYSAK